MNGTGRPGEVASVAVRLRERAALVERVAAELSSGIAELVEEVRTVLDEGGTLFFCGNGGSAADAQHLAAEYVVRFRANRRALPAIALTTDTSVLTAAANDFGFEHVFSRQIRALAREGDLLFLHSTSGTSPNLIEAARAAHEVGVRTVGLLARGGGALLHEVDWPLVIPTDETALAQELHLMIGHEICARVEGSLHEPDSPMDGVIEREGQA